MSEHKVKKEKLALVFSGGGSRGAYEMGVWRALRELGMEPEIVTGTSIGAMNAALVAQGTFKTGCELWETMETKMVFDYEHVIENKGVKFTGIKDLLDGKLVEEDIRKSPVDFGIVTVKFPSMEPVHLWKEEIPEGKLMDYIFASCSCFPVVAPYEIDGEKYLDGGFADYIPIRQALEKKADRIVAVDLDGYGKTVEADVAEAGDRLTMIESHWDLGNFAVFEPSKAKRLMRLGYLDAMRTFGVFDGRRYAFIKGEVNQRNIKAAEEAAADFEVDPRIIYSKEHFVNAVAAAIEEYKAGDDPDVVLLQKNLKRFNIKDNKENKDAPKDKFDLGDLKEFVDSLGSVNRKARLLLLASLLRRFGYAFPDDTPIEEIKQPPFPLPRPLKKLLGDDLPAAIWLVKLGLA